MGVFRSVSWDLLFPPTYCLNAENRFFYLRKAFKFLRFLKWHSMDSLNKTFKHQHVSWLIMRPLSGKPFGLQMYSWLARSLKQYRQCTYYSLRMFRGKLFTTSKVYKIWTSFPPTICISAIKMVVYIAIKPQAGKQGKDCRRGREKNLTQNHSIPL